MSLDDGKSTPAAATASIEVSATAPIEPSSASAPAAAVAVGFNGDGAAGGAGDETKLSKKQMKKLAKGKGKEKKEKPTWNQPGEGNKKKKQNDDKAASAMPSLPKQAADFVNLTPKGHKKDLSTQPMADAYHPAAVEAAWQEWWEASGYYSCDPAFAAGKSDKEKFVMVIPPPNVTGSLHLGHALTAAVEDTLTRWHRMLGHATLYVPGE